MKIKCLYIYLLLLFCLALTAQEKKVPEQEYLPEDSSKIMIKRLELNSRQSDFSPRQSGNELVFVSGRPNELAVTYTNALNTEVTDIFYAPQRDSVRFGMVKPFSKNINSIYNEGPFSLSSDGTAIYFSGNAKEGHSKKRTNRLQIYFSSKAGNSWTDPQPAAFCDPGNSNFHPALSKDSRELVFCSDMPGGFGGIDLYSTRYENGQWSKPENLGPTINSASNELFPYISGDNMLYFSSNRPGGPGGLDLYCIKLNSRTTAKVALLEVPVNSASDDFGLCLDSTGKAGYFTTNRVPKYSDDIYYFYSYPDFSEAKSPPVKNRFCYSFFEQKDSMQLEATATPSITYSYEWDFGNGQKMRGESCRYCFDKPGDYSVQLNIVEKNSGEVFYNKITYTLTVEEPPKIFIDCPETVDAGTEIALDTYKCGLKGYELSSFYWSFGDGKYNQGRKVKHTYRKNGTYTIELGVIAKNIQTQKLEKFKVEKNILIKSTI